MLSFDSLPQARVVRTHGQVITPPPAPPAPPTAVQRLARESLEILVGMWPLTSVMLFAIALLVLMGRYASP